MRDQDFGPVRVRAFGTYSLRAVEPKTLLSELVGTDSVYEADEISEWLRSIINSAFADVVASSGIAVLDLSARYKELSSELREEVQTRIDDEYGLELPMLNIVNISLPAEVERALDQRSSMGVVGDLRAYHNYQMARAIPDAAVNPAGGIAGAGMGLGMGMAMAGPMLQGSGGAAGPAPQVPPPPPPQVWHMAEKGQALGPMTLQQLAGAAAGGRLRPDTLMWTAGMEEWSAAGTIAQLAPLFQNAPPPIPQSAQG
jgi:membrane protease subunit (stomatin/prohibitin family)